MEAARYWRRSRRVDAKVRAIRAEDSHLKNLSGQWMPIIVGKARSFCEACKRPESSFLHTTAEGRAASVRIAPNSHTELAK